MLKALFRKQLQETTAFLFTDGKNGGRRSGMTIVLYCLLMLITYFAFGAMFFALASVISVICRETGQTAVYDGLVFAAALIVGTIMGILGSYSTLYKARDNELLLSMPIPPKTILTVRMSSVAVMILLTALDVVLPAAAADPSGFTGKRIAAYVLMTLFAALTGLALSCLFGFLAALVLEHIRRKSLVAAFACLAFLGAYFWVVANGSRLLYSLLEYITAEGGTLNRKFRLLRLLGLAAEGDVPYLLLCGAAALLLALAAWITLNRSFIRIVTRKGGAEKTEYREKTAALKSADAALFRKEWKRYTSSSIYMLNSTLSSVFMLVGAVLLLVFRETVTEQAALITGFLPEGSLPLLGAAALGMLCSMNIITAPSISLEGRNIWITQSLPVSGASCLKAKERLHLVLTMPPALLFAGSISLVFGFTLPETAVLLLFTVLFVFFGADFGLILNLWKHNLSWTSDTVPVKQGASTAFAMFGSWLIVVLTAFLGIKLMGTISAVLYLLLCSLLTAVSVFLMKRYLNGRGGEKFVYI